jgi:endonuclease/exonuclease/phosphatase family metal-dependent hydrolase
MPWYNDLRSSEDPNKQDYSLVFPQFTKTEKVRTIDNLLKLRQYISKNIQVKKTDKNLILSSWNIKQFGFLKQRLPESYFYIAEIISSFDLVAIQEVKKGLKDLEILMKLLGEDWNYLMNDVTEGNAGNSERFAYIYNTKRVDFTGLAGEIVLWKELFEENEEIIQLKRSPYMTGFRAGWKAFALLSVHLQPGNDAGSRSLRKREVEFLMKALTAKKKAKTLWTENIIILGDFNLYKNNEEIFEAFRKNDFIESDILKDLTTNTAKSGESFDRMFFKQNDYFEVPRKENHKGGVVNIFDILYTIYGEYKAEKIFEKFAGDDAKGEKYFKNYWRKDQLSDHNPIWIEIDIDSTDRFLRDKRKELEQ